MNIDYNAVIEVLKSFLNNEKIEILGISVGEERQVREAIKNLLTAYEKEKEKNKKAIDFINQRKKIVNKDMAEGTRLQVGTFMWQVDELLEILKGVEEE